MSLEKKVFIVKKTTIKEEEKKIRELLQKHVHRIINRDHDAFIDILEIMMGQEKWLDKLNTIKAFKITRSRLNRALILQVKVYNFSRFLTVSWRKGSVKKRKEKNPLQSAFRQSIYRQIMLWKKLNNNSAECVICKDTHHSYLKLQTDHKEPSFLQLTKDFLSRDINKDVPIEFDYHYRCGRKFKKKDNRFKIRWQNYHRKNMVLQWLCRKCNLKKNKSKNINESKGKTIVNNNN